MIVVTCNGCFDAPLHQGHLFFLGYCLAQGDRLVVGINSDEYIIRHKRSNPASEKERIRALEEIGITSKVVVFGEDEPSEFIRRVMPNVHCIGEEYRGIAPEIETCKSVGARIVYVPRIQKWSSTLIKGGYGNKKKEGIG